MLCVDHGVIIIKKKNLGIACTIGADLPVIGNFAMIAIGITALDRIDAANIPENRFNAPKTPCAQINCLLHNTYLT